MAKRQGRVPKKTAVEIVSAIGSLGYDLQYYDEATIEQAVEFLRKVNPKLFDWLVDCLIGLRPSN